jgi:cysteine sulfinic acid decarboxylase, putative
MLQFCLNFEQAHYSFIKSSIWMGLGTESIIKVSTDERGKMIPDELEKAIVKAIEDKNIPYFVACTSGTTVLGAFDPLKPISEICSKYKLWMHVDASLGGTFLLSSKHRHLLSGIKAADSVAWNLHKLAVCCSTKF